MKNEIWKKEVTRSTKNLALWTFLWVASMALATFGPKFIWDEQFALTLIGVIINTIFGAGMIIANVKHLNSLDELQKKIQLSAMGMALGVGVVGGLSYSLLDTTNLIGTDAEISFLVILISITYAISLVIGQIRYK